MIKESGQDNAMLSTVGQMSLCFTETILSGLAILAYFVGTNVFYVIFVLSIISTLDIQLLLTKSKEKA